jgi:hypothetical protein
MIQAAKSFAMRKPGPTMSGLWLINIISVVASSDPRRHVSELPCRFGSDDVAGVRRKRITVYRHTPCLDRDPGLECLRMQSHLCTCRVR